MRTAAVVLLLVVVTARAADPAAPDQWPHWRRPLASGTAPPADPPTPWDAQTHVKWTADVPGKGSASPIVWGDQVFIVTAVETDKQAKAEDIPKPDSRFKVNTNPPTTYHQFIVLSLDRATGKERWRQVAAQKV